MADPVVPVGGKEEEVAARLHRERLEYRIRRVLHRWSDSGPMEAHREVERNPTDWVAVEEAPFRLAGTPPGLQETLAMAAMVWTFGRRLVKCTATAVFLAVGAGVEAITTTRAPARGVEKGVKVGVVTAAQDNTSPLQTAWRTQVGVGVGRKGSFPLVAETVVAASC